MVGAENTIQPQTPAYVTFVIGLSVDLHMGAGTTIDAYERVDSDLPEFFVPQVDSPPSLRVDTRFVFRTISAEQTSDKAPALTAFEDFWEGLDFIESEPAARLVGNRVPGTAVAATTGLMLRTRDGRGLITEATLTQRFDKVLGQLNEFLTMLAFRLQNPDIGPVRRTDLPPQVPVVIDADLATGAARTLELVAFQLHGFEDAEQATTESILDAHDWAFRNRARPWPFRSVVSLLQRAHRDGYGGEYEQSVIALGTATELLTETVVAEALRVEGASDEAIERTLKCGLANLLRRHLRPFLAAQEADTTAVANWLDDAYLLRKRVVHEGYVPTNEESKVAYQRTRSLAMAVSQAIRSDDRLSSLAEQFPVAATH
jgi:hypothetical protein